MPALYVDLLQNFVCLNTEQVLGSLTGGLAKEGFDINPATTFSWQKEIEELQAAFRCLLGLLPSIVPISILLEYVLPIIGQRIDCVLLINDIIFVIEYKGGRSATARSALRQAQDYALNLVDFHEVSRWRTAVPIAVGEFKAAISLDEILPQQGAAVGSGELANCISRSYQSWGGKGSPIEVAEWNNSRYFPVPTIIQAASAIYSNHNVRDLARSRAGKDNLEATQSAVSRAVRDAVTRSAKKLIVITGVPGAGKTLAGLNAVQLLNKELDLNQDQAAFLSGNSPLVAVLQQALKQSVRSSKKGVARSVQSRIREVHRFVKESYENGNPPADRLIVFDEAQRAWTAAKNLKKFGRDVSEPKLVLEIMGRHDGWAVIVALVGGGQEIHAGEAGLAAWGDAIAAHSEWEVITSHEALFGGSSVAGSRLFRESQSESKKVKQDIALHLSVSKRSYESDVTAPWVNAILDGRADQAQLVATEKLPIFLTRDMEAARSWLRANGKGNRRVGLIASSGAARLRADGIETPSFNFLKCIDYVKWFLEPAGDHRSSNQLEVALSEFELQGLELDLIGLLWGGDLVFPEKMPAARVLRGRKWCVVSGTGDPQASADDLRTRILNKYRVLLTRFRKGMVIFVPVGSATDETRSQADFDGVYSYLLNCGARRLT